jgi:DNA modification methylase
VQLLSFHPTVKPLALLSEAILDTSNRGETVLDPFAGSGSLMLAADRVGRVAACIELDPKYVDVAVRRMEAETGAGTPRGDGSDVRRGRAAARDLACHRAGVRRGNGE